MLAADVGPLVGYKIGCTSAVMQRYLDIPHPCGGGVFSRGVHSSGVSLRHGDYVRVGVECEIAVRLARDLTPTGSAFTAETVADAIDAYHPAIEIVDDRYADWRTIGAPTLVADDFFAAGCVLGTAVPRAEAPDLPDVVGVALINGVEVGRGTGADVLGHPHAALAWLANHLAAGAQEPARRADRADGEPGADGVAQCRRQGADGDVGAGDGGGGVCVFDTPVVRDLTAASSFFLRAFSSRRGCRVEHGNARVSSIEVIAANITQGANLSGTKQSDTSSYPVIAVQELVRNAIIHRNYEGTASPVMINWYSDRIEITSPGGPYGAVTAATFGQPGLTDARNPALATAAKALGFVQRFGSWNSPREGGPKRQQKS